MIGKDVSNYHIVERIGTGASGVVYRATHSSLELTVAIKFLSDDLIADADARRRFLRGAKAVAALDHPNVCRFYDAGETAEGRLFLAMSFCDGPTLRDRLKKGPLPIKEAVDIAIAVTDGLAHAHRRRVIHRDIKPANIMLSTDSSVKIVDFGLAALLDEATITKSTETVGTFLYMSPEQVNGRRLDPRTDIFSFGSVFYEMLTGVAPFEADNPGAVIHAITSYAHKPLSEMLTDAPEALCRVVDRALAKDVGERYQDASDMRDDLVDVANEMDPEHPRRPFPRARPLVRWWRRHALGATVAAVIIAGLLALTDSPVPHPDFTIAIIAVEPHGDAQRLALAEGIARDATARMEEVTADDARFVVPRDQIKLLEVKSPEKAPGLVGANRILGVRTVPDGDGGRVEFTRYDADSTVVRRASGQVDFGAESFDSRSLTRTICRVLGMNAPRHALDGYTASGPAFREYARGLGYLDAGAGSLDAAMTSLGRAVAADSSFARAWAALGAGFRQRYQSSHDSTAAARSRRCCRRALRIDSDLAGAHLTLGRLLATMGDAGAETELRTAVSLEPRESEAIHELGNYYLFTVGRMPEAEATYRRGTLAQPRDVSAFERLGYFYYVQGRYPEAIAQFQIDAALAPKRQQTFNYLGGCYFVEGCWEAAVDMFERSFSLGRTFVSCSNLGTLYYMEHRYGDAVSMFQWAREYRPDYYELLANLASAENQIPGRHDRARALNREALALAEKARATESRNATYLAILAGLYPAVQSDSVTAIAERALALAPNNSDVRYRVALAYESAGERAKALKQLAAAVDLGHSIRQIESEPALDSLRKDERYAIIAKRARRNPIDCPPR